MTCDRLLTQREVADRLGVCVRTVYELRRARKMRYLQLTARAIRIRESELKKFEQRMEREA